MRKLTDNIQYDAWNQTDNMVFVFFLKELLDVYLSYSNSKFWLFSHLQLS